MTPTAPRSTSTAWSGTASTRPAAPAPAARSTRTPATGTEALAVLRYVALAARPEWLIWRPTLPASGTDSAAPALLDEGTASLRQWATWPARQPPESVVVMVVMPTNSTPGQPKSI